MKNLKPEFLFLRLSLFFIPIMIFIMPINKAPDEANHARIAWGIVHNSEEDKGSIQWMKLVNSKTYEKKVNKNQLDNIFKEKIDLSKEKLEWNFKLSNIVHIPQLIGLLIGSIIYPSIGVMFLLGRIFNALTYILGVFFILKYSKFAKNALVFISLCPIMIQQAASLSYDVMNYLAIVLFFSILTNFLKTRIIDRKKIIFCFFSILFLILTKRNNIILLLFIPFLAYEMLNNKVVMNRWFLKLKELLSKFKIILSILTLFFVMLVAYTYLQGRGGFFHFVLIMINSIFDNNINNDLNPILGIGIFGNLGLLQIQLPLWLIFIDVAFIFLLMFIEKSKISISSFFGNISLVIFILQIISIIAGMYFEWTPIVIGQNANHSVGAQGRYVTPFLIYLSLFVVSRNDFVSIKTENNRYFSRSTMSLLSMNFLIMVYLIVSYYYFPMEPQDFFMNLKNSFLN